MNIILVLLRLWLKPNCVWPQLTFLIYYSVQTISCTEQCSKVIFFIIYYYILLFHFQLFQLFCYRCKICVTLLFVNRKTNKIKNVVCDHNKFLAASDNFNPRFVFPTKKFTIKPHLIEKFMHLVWVFYTNIIHVSYVYDNYSWLVIAVPNSHFTKIFYIQA